MSTKQKQFEEYCRLGNLEEIKKIIKDEDFLKEASLDYIRQQTIINWK